MPAAEPVFVEPPAPRRPLTRARIDGLASRFFGGFGLVFGAMALPQLLDQQSILGQPAGWIAVALVYAGLVAAAIAALAQRAIGSMTVAFCYAYLLALVAWPFVFVQQQDAAPVSPWLWTLLTIATGSAALGMRFADAVVYTVAAPLCYGLVFAESNGWRGLENACFETVYSLLLGGILLAILTMVRQSASRVDHAQDAALGGYAATVHAEASEAERVGVDALVHDSVLTTLLAAATSATPEAERLAAEMAADALAHLRSGRSGADWDADGADVARLAARLRDAVLVEGGGFELRTAGSLDAELTADAEDALYSATVQAMVNSIQHAGDEVHRLLAVTGTPAGVRIEVVDDGVGFEPDAVPPGRLGLAVSIRRRIAVAGGAAEVSSRPGAGTSVVLRWPEAGAR